MSRSTTKCLGLALSLVAFASLTGCGARARSAEEYRDGTAGLLATRNDQIRACYDDHRKTNPASQGNVTVEFKVEKNTGTIKDARVLGAASEPLRQCVLKSLDGLSLSPGDGRRGDATFTWEFVAQRPGT